MKKRNLFAEIAEGFDALAKARAGKRTLPTHEVEISVAHGVRPLSVVIEHGEDD